MHNEPACSIQVINFTAFEKFDQYELQICTPEHTYTYNSRFSELRALFCDSAPDSLQFPSCCYVTTALRPLLSHSFRQRLNRSRFQGLKEFFHQLSTQTDLDQSSEFWCLVGRARDWEAQVLASRRPKPLNLGHLLAQSRNNLVYVS